MIKLKLQSLKLKIAVLFLNIVSVAGALTFSIISDNQVNSLTSQRGAEKWQSDSNISYSQISCFFAGDSGMDSNSVNAIRSEIKSAMNSASLKEEENKRLWIDNYTSSMGKMEVSGTKRGTAKTEVTAVTSDFFLIHDFKFMDGSYFRDEDLLENGIVIDRTLAWQIFGSDEVTGMTACIDNISFYVVGVVDNPECSAEEKAYGEFPRAYISYESAKAFSDNGEYFPVDCYEAVVPNPVKNFAYNTINDFVEKQYENTSYTIENSTRFTLLENFKRLRHLSDSVIIENAVEYPWWENAARVTQVKVSLNLFAVIVFLIIPVVTLVIFLIKLFRIINSMHIIKRLTAKIKDKIPY